MDIKDDMKRFKHNLDETHDWPCEFDFKCIVPVDGLTEVMRVFRDDEVVKRMSRTGKYVSVTATRQVQGSDEVLVVYEELGKIPKVICM